MFKLILKNNKELKINNFNEINNFNDIIELYINYEIKIDFYYDNYRFYHKTINKPIIIPNNLINLQKLEIYNCNKIKLPNSLINLKK